MSCRDIPDNEVVPGDGGQGVQNNFEEEYDEGIENDVENNEEGVEGD